MEQSKIKPFRRTDVLFFGSILFMLLLILINYIVNIPFLTKLVNQDNTITLTWLIVLSIIIFPVRFFPKSKWGKWWNALAFSTKK
jgi:hypothetical protein